MGLLDGKVSIITGGAGSVGLASARAFLREGAKVMLVDLRESDLQRAAQDLNSPNVATHAADVSQAAATKAYVDATVAKWGKIDVLFSNAGTSGVVAPVHEYPEDVFELGDCRARTRRLPRLPLCPAADERRRQHHHHLERRRCAR